MHEGRAGGRQDCELAQSGCLGIDEDGEDITTCVVNPLDADTISSTKKKVTGQAALALAILHETLAESDEVPPPDVQTRTCLEKSWQANWYAKTASDDTTQTAKQKAFVWATNANVCFREGTADIEHSLLTSAFGNEN